MSLFDRIRSALGFKPRLRNRAGGMAWIVGLSNLAGDGVLNGRAAKTVRINEFGVWDIDPPQRYLITRACTFVLSGRTAFPGDVVTISGLADEHLEPWRDMDWSAKDESHRYLPSVPPQRVPATSPTSTETFNA